MKYVIICGGSVSGIGKGTIISCIGVLLKACGYRVTAIKIDPYLNVDAGTMSPYEHGEVFVLEDGGEADLDLGNYERFLNVTLSWHHNITTGKIYKNIIERERRGDYLGKTVQVIPHVTDEIQDWILKVSKYPVGNLEPGGSPMPKAPLLEPDICLIEIGGTVGDLEGATYFETIRQMTHKLGRHNVCLVFVSYVPYLKGSGEIKTKPTQHGVKELMALGLQPSIIVSRCEISLSESAFEKISLFTGVPKERVFCLEDVDNIFKVPLLLENREMSKQILEILQLPPKNCNISTWVRYSELCEQLGNSGTPVKIVIVGKYTGLEDSYISLTKALTHASLAISHKLELNWVESTQLENSESESWELLRSADGILIPGGFGSRGSEGKILAANFARINQKPFLGICLGMQIAVIEYSRNVLNLNANSAEIDPSVPDPVIIDMPELDQVNKGATMRLGSRNTLIKDESLASLVYNEAIVIEERHRHRYEVNPKYIQQLEEAGLIFSGRDESNTRMEIIEMDRQVHPFFFGTQFHPEFKTKPFVPSPPFYGFLLASAGKLITEPLDVHKAFY